jgi:hypothetical protein
MKFGAIIRSVGERTEQLCFESVNSVLPKSNISVVKDVYPFSEAVKRMIVFAKERVYDWYIGVDADTVLVPNWLEMIESTLDNIRDIGFYYKLDFQLQDKFVRNKYIYGLHLYNGRYNDKMLKILEETKDTSKCEGNIRHKISAKFVNLNSGPIGYHGYEQYYREIYNRFAVRSFRNPEDRQRYNLFKVNDKDNSVGWEGWWYGLKNKDTVLRLLDARNKILSSEFGYKEKLPLKMELEEFYENVKR